LPAEGFHGSKKIIAEERAGLGPMNRGECVALVAFLLAAFLWIFRKDIEFGAFTIPGWWRYVTFGWEDVLGRPLETLPPPLAKLLRQDSGDAAVAIIIGGALLFIPVSLRHLRFALDLRWAAGTPWHLLILLGGGFAMAFGIEASGLSKTIAGLLTGVGDVHPFLIFLMVCMLTVALSEVASNTATASIVLPLIAASAGNFGIAPAPLMLAATIAASFGFMLPAGTPPNAIVFASGYITVPQMARNGFLIDLFGALLVATLCYLLAPWALT
jgi:sodium-dependent dicarboxylate transporter 2/3/5